MATDQRVTGGDLTVAELLDQLAADLADPGIPPARGRARDLIAAVLDKPRYWPATNGEHSLDAATIAEMAAAAVRLRRGMPFAYAVGRAPFRHLTLRVDARVLIPRPETEMLVDIVLDHTRAGTVADIGTGSGAIALALAAEGAFKRIIATDASADALAVARSNLDCLPPNRRAHVEFRAGDWLSPLRGEQVEVVVSNPPYISPSEARELPASVREWEPALALFSEADGMSAIRAIVRDAPSVVVPGGLLVLEIDSRRAACALECAATDARWRDVDVRRDLTGRERFLVARRKES